MDTILFIRTYSNQKPAYQDRFTGVCRFAHARGWHVQAIDRPEPRHLPSLLHFWQPIGCIVESGSWRNDYPEKLFRPLPVIYLDRDPSTIRNAFCVAHDPKPTVELAAKELLSLGLTHFAFVPNYSPVTWSRSRERLFRETLALHGFVPVVFRSRETADTPRWRGELASWLKGLPKPCAVFAVNDPVGEAVLSAAAAYGIAVPDELAVVAVDNSEAICENTHPTLSSVALDFVGAGYLSAQLLAERIADPSLPPCCRFFAPLATVRRASTRLFRYRDARVVDALKFISTAACGKISVRDVSARMGCSRRLAELRFRERVGKSILEAIQDVRFEHACTLLRTTTASMRMIANSCGYSQDVFLQKLFRKRLGKTMAEWRAALYSSSS